MTTTDLKLETVTPMFLHGADNKTPELRPPPFKALFRYWWRAVQNCDADTLREDEAKLFGSTDGKAPFSIRIPGKTNHIGKPKEYSPLPHKNNFRTDAYDVGKPFNLQLITKNTSDASRYKQIAKLGFLLGGIGNRSRRGFGSIRETSWNFTCISDLRDEVLKTLNAVSGPGQFQIDPFNINGRTVKIIKPKNRLRNPKFPVISRIFFGEPKDSVRGLLTDTGWATSNHADDALGYANKRFNNRRIRLSSPIHVRIQKVKSGYIPVVTQLWSLFPQNRIPHNFENKQLNFIDAIIK